MVTKPAHTPYDTSAIRKAVADHRFTRASLRREKPSVVYTDDTIASATSTCLSALGTLESVFQYNDTLCELVADDSGSGQLVPIKEGRLRVLLAECVYIFEPSNRKDTITGEYIQPIGAPKKLIDACLQTPNFPGVRKIRQFLKAPTILRNGTILCKHGYDSAAEIYLKTSIDITLSDAPTREDALAAYEYLESTLFSEFNFSSDTEAFGPTMLMSALLTAVAAPGLSVGSDVEKIFKAPGYALSATERGSGKSTAYQLICNIATGASYPVLAYAVKSQKEASDKLRAEIETWAMTGRQFVWIDNWPNALPFGDANVATSILSTSRTIRVYGSNSDVRDVPDRMIWFVNGNNLTITRESDLDRRILGARLVLSKRKFKLGQTEQACQWARDNRKDLLEKCLTILHVFIRDGIDDPALESVEDFASFYSWDRFIRRAILWYGRPDPILANQYTTKEYTDNSEGNFIAFLKEWYALFKSEPVALQTMADGPQDTTYLLESLYAFRKTAVRLNRDGDPFKVDGYALSMALAIYQDRVVGPFRLHRHARARAGRHTWHLELVGSLQDADPGPETPIAGKVKQFQKPKQGTAPAQTDDVPY